MMKITITGIPETQAMLNGIVNQSSTNSQAVLKEISDFMVNEAKNNAHVITGNMKGSINSTVADKNATVTAGAEYSSFENRRSGSKGGTTHDFMDRAVEATLKEIPNICSKNAYRWSTTKVSK